MSVYCKYIECDWNYWDCQNLKYRCNKVLVHIDRKGFCEIKEIMAMNDEQFKELQFEIKKAMDALETLQRIHVKQTGKRFVMGQPIGEKWKLT